MQAVDIGKTGEVSGYVFTQFAAMLDEAIKLDKIIAGIMIPKLLKNKVVYQQVLPRIHERLIHMDPNEKIDAEQLKVKFPETDERVRAQMMQAVDIDKKGEVSGYVFTQFAAMLDEAIKLDNIDEKS